MRADAPLLPRSPVWSAAGDTPGPRQLHAGGVGPTPTAPMTTTEDALGAVPRGCEACAASAQHSPAFIRHGQWSTSVLPMLDSALQAPCCMAPLACFALPFATPRCRTPYNAALKQRITLWKQRGISRSRYQQEVELKTLRAELPEYGTASLPCPARCAGPAGEDLECSCGPIE